jgi:hypothetical protein
MSRPIKLKPDGSFHRFAYSYYGTPDCHPDHTAHSGQVVQIVRPLNRNECDDDSWPTYKVRARDGWIGTACHDELKTAKPTSQDIEAAFWNDLKEFQAKYPMCYIESWTPGDFVSTSGQDTCGANWNAQKHITTAGSLSHHFDAEYGTNWERIRNAIT